jgi:transcription initiation factor TFIID subunit 8
MTPKRSLSPENNDIPDAKRTKIDELQEVQGTSEPPNVIENIPSQQESPMSMGTDDSATADKLVELDAPFVSTLPTLHFQSRQTIQRSIALVLSHDGFDAATPEALEGFTQLVETCKFPQIVQIAPTRF